MSILIRLRSVVLITTVAFEKFQEKFENFCFVS